MGKVNENLTSVLLAASVITLTLGYMSKLLLKQASASDLVSKHCWGTTGGHGGTWWDMVGHGGGV